MIEIVVVTVLLAILSVTAAPRFLNVQDDARAAAYLSLKAAFQSTITLFHSKWLVDGEPNPNNIAGREGEWGYKIYNLHFNQHGYPRISKDKQECEAIFENLLPDSSLTKTDFKVTKTGEKRGNDKTGNVCTYDFNSTLFSLRYHEITGEVTLFKRNEES